MNRPINLSSYKHYLPSAMSIFIGLASFVVGFVLTTLGQEYLEQQDQSLKLWVAIGGVTVLLLLVSIYVFIISHKKVKELDKIQEDLKRYLHKSIFHHGELNERYELFDILRQRCEQAETSIVIVNYFSSKENSKLNKTASQVTAYYSLLNDIVKKRSVKYTRIIQLPPDDYKKILSKDTTITNFVRDGAQWSHFFQLAKADDAKIDGYEPCAIIAPRWNSMTYTIIDGTKLLIQIDHQPTEAQPVIAMWGILEVDAPKEVIDVLDLSKKVWSATGLENGIEILKQKHIPSE